jgi:hypothetical protein
VAPNGSSGTSGVLETLAGRLDETYLDRWADELGIRGVLDGLRSAVAAGQE